MSSIVQSLRVDDPSDFKAAMMSLFGWTLLDVTYDPHQRNWVMTFKWDIGSTHVHR